MAVELKSLGPWTLWNPWKRRNRRTLRKRIKLCVCSGRALFFFTTLVSQTEGLKTACRQSTMWLKKPNICSTRYLLKLLSSNWGFWWDTWLDIVLYINICINMSLIDDPIYNTACGMKDESILNFYVLAILISWFVHSYEYLFPFFVLTNLFVCISLL
jgi:hypothetical protein